MAKVLLGGLGHNVNKQNDVTSMRGVVRYKRYSQDGCPHEPRPSSKYRGLCSKHSRTVPWHWGRGGGEGVERERGNGS